MKHKRRTKSIIGGVLLVGLAGVGGLLLSEWRGTLSGQLSHMHQPTYETLTFSPESRWFAYLWRDAVNRIPHELGARPLLLTDSLELRWFPVGHSELERSRSLASIDLRPEGQYRSFLDGAVRFSPDAAHLAAVTPECVLIVDLNSNHEHTIRFKDELFKSLHWLDADEFAFSTVSEDRFAVWRHTLDEAPDARRMVYEKRSRRMTMNNGMGPRLENAEASPNGRYWFVTRERKDGSRLTHLLLDVQTGKQFPFDSTARDVCWTSDSSEVLVRLSDEVNGARPFLRVHTETWETDDLTSQFSEAFGVDADLTLVADRWTPDDHCVIYYATTWIPPESPDHPPLHRMTGYVVQIEPWRVILSQPAILRWSPVPGWVLLQGDNDFQWLSESGSEKIPVEGWVNDWTWSPNGAYAAQVEDSSVTIFRPALPPTSLVTDAEQGRDGAQ